jgi:hypothetical protein
MNTNESQEFRTTTNSMIRNTRMWQYVTALLFFASFTAYFNVLNRNKKQKFVFVTTLEDGAVRLSRNVSNELPFYASLLVEKPLSCTLQLLYKLLHESP